MTHAQELLTLTPKNPHSLVGRIVIATAKDYKATSLSVSVSHFTNEQADCTGFHAVISGSFQ